MAFDKKGYAEQKKQELQTMTNNAVRKVLDFKKDPKKVVEVLEFMAKSPQYSFKNQMMVQSQYKGSSFTMGSRQFKEHMGLNVNEKARPIKIVAPVISEYFKRDDKNIQIRYASKEEKEKIKNNEIKTFKDVWYYKLVDVYDITQTNAKAEDYPEYYPNRRIEFYKKDPTIVKDIIEANKKLLRSKGIELIENHNVNAMGSGIGFAGKQPDGTIIVGYRNGLNDGEIMHTLLHETAHAFYHVDKEKKPTNQKEFEAEMTAYVVSKRFGLDTERDSIQYIAEWTDNMSNIEDIEQSIKSVSKYSSEIINKIEKEIDPERIKEFYKNNPDLLISTENTEFGNIEMKSIEINEENKSMFKRVTKEQIDKAMDTDIIKLAIHQGHELKQVNENIFIDVNNSKLSFNKEKNTFYDKDTKSGGNAINLIRKENELSFPQSVRELMVIQNSEAFKTINTPKRKLPISKEKVKEAEAKSIFDVASDLGYTFKKAGKYYVGIEHDSLVLNPIKNTYNWYSKAEYGTPINLVMREKGLDFKNAVNYLNNENFEQAKVSTVKYDYDPSKYEYKEKEDMHSSKNYLINRRMIDENLVNDLIQKNVIKEDKKRNVVFQWKDQDGNVVGSDKRGTGNTQFRGIDKGSDIRHAFHFTTIDKPKDIYIFEAPIDALSYKSLYKDKEGVFVSMNGLKKTVAMNQIGMFMKQYNEMPKVHLCVDNDEAGNKFVQNFGEFENKETGETIEIKAEQPQMPDCKDWNDVLVEKHYNEKEKEHEQETKIIVNERNEYASKPQSNSSSNTKTAKKEKKSLVMEV